MSGAKAVQRSPGKSTLVEAAYSNAAAATSETTPVQRKGGGGEAGQVHAAAEAGVSGPGGPLPFGDRIQSLFGGHDLSRVRAHTGPSAAAASASMGATAYATGDNIAFGGTPDLHTTAHEAAHVVQQRGGVQLKGGVGEAGDPYEHNADQVADRVVAGQSAADLLPAVTGSGGGTAVQRNVPPPSTGAAGTDPTAKDPAAKDPAAAQVKAASVELTSATGKILLLIIRQALGAPATQAEKDAATMAVDQLTPSDFATLMAALQKNGLMEAFLATIGSKNAEQTVQGMDVQFEVPAVAFTGCTPDAVKAHYDLANKILKPNNMKVTQPSFTAVGNTDKEKKSGKDEKSLIGNTAGTFKEADLDADGAALDKVIDSFLNPGMITSFWFSDLVEDVATYGNGRTLHGQAVREKSAAKHKGKEAVFMDVHAAGHVFVHELGHIIGGKGAEAEHATGADGTPATGDQNNVMFQFVMPGKDQTKLTPAQLQAFKTGVYARIQRVPLIGDFPTPGPNITGLA
ncbi:MAG TPA: DUF4157 domain-containing protein [Kofleriaceae bacterium]